MSRLFGWDYPPGAEHDPNAPYNQPAIDATVDHFDCEDCGFNLSSDFVQCPECGSVNLLPVMADEDEEPDDPRNEYERAP